MLPEPIAVTLQVTQLLKKLNIPYLIGGSFASTVHGLIRTTQDTDLMVVLQPQHVTPLVNALQNQFYLDENAIREAILHRRNFNLIHLETMFKVDVFVPSWNGIGWAARSQIASGAMRWGCSRCRESGLTWRTSVAGRFHWE